jgi:hypothetical protein
MKVFVFIGQRPLRIRTYTSLTALYEDNKDMLGISKSTLDKWQFNSFDYVNNCYIISKTETKSTGNVRKV